MLSSMFPSGESMPFGQTPRLVNNAGPTNAGPFSFPPAPAAGPVPSSTAGPFPTSQRVPQGSSRGQMDIGQMIIPALVAAFGPKVGPRGIAAMLKGVMRGRDAKRAMSEREEDTLRRRAGEAAEFRMHAMKELMAANSPEETAALVEYPATHGGVARR